MDGKRIQEYWSNEMDAMLKTYKQFQVLIPSEKFDGAAHNGEDGRYVESLLKEYLQRYLPKNLEVLSGFILKPAVKTGINGRERKKELDAHSTQLDLLIYDSANFPIFQRFADNAIVPPEGVVAIISVKKHLHDNDIENEASALLNAATLCSSTNSNGEILRGPYMAIISMESKINKSTLSNEEWIFKKLEKVYDKTPRPTFDCLVGYIGALSEWSIFKKRPNNDTNAEYIFFKHGDSEYHLGLQFLLTGILSVYYDPTRNITKRPGFTAFPSGRKHDKNLGSIEVSKLR